MSMEKFSADVLGKDYLWGDEPICREERQYALFMYNRLRDLIGKEIEVNRHSDSKPDYWLEHGINSDEEFLKICGLEGTVKIKEVFYEVTFMRDFFKYYKAMDAKNHIYAKSFNRNLIDYVNRGGQEDFNDWQEYLTTNLGKAPIAKDELVLHKRVRNMMNSKPDIGILYEKNNVCYMKFIECKYLSSQGKQNGEPQHVIQNNILEFLCECVFADVEADIDKSNGDEIVRFCNHKGNFKAYTNVKIKDISSYCRKPV